MLGIFHIRLKRVRQAVENIYIIWTPQFTTLVLPKQLTPNVSIKSWEIAQYIIHMPNESATFVQNVVFIS